MDEKILQILGNAVINQITVRGKFSTNEYSACDLMNLSLDSLDALYVQLNELSKKYESQGLLNRTKANDKLEAQKELVATIFTVKKDLLELSDKLEKIRKEKAKKLQLLKHAKEIREIDAINKLSDEDLDKELAELEA